VNLIANTRTDQGLVVKAALDESGYGNRSPLFPAIFPAKTECLVKDQRQVLTQTPCLGRKKPGNPGERLPGTKQGSRARMNRWRRLRSSPPSSTAIGTIRSGPAKVDDFIVSRALTSSTSRTNGPSATARRSTSARTSTSW